jgi:hypothetical protein
MNLSLLELPCDGSASPSVVLANVTYGDNSRLAVGGTAVFWSTTSLGSPFPSAIYRCELPDCPGGPKLFAMTSGGPCWTSKLIADESTGSLFWLDQCREPQNAGVVKRCPFSGCESEPEVVTPGPPIFVDFALSEHDLWLSQASLTGINPGILRRPR